MVHFDEMKFQILFKGFWILWASQDLQIGSGQIVKQNHVATMKPTNHYHIHGIAFRTGGGVLGEWIYVDGGSKLLLGG